MYHSNKHWRRQLAVGVAALAIWQIPTQANAVLVQSSGPYAFAGSASVTDINPPIGATTISNASMGAATVVSQFNPTLGVLTAVSHQVQSSRTVTLAGSGGASTTTATATGSSARGSANLAAPGMSVTFSQLSAPNGSCTSISSCSYTTTSGPVATNGSFAVSSASLDAYVGSGTVAVTRSAPTLTVTSGGTKPSTSATLSESWSGTLTSSYEYQLHALPSFDPLLMMPVLSLDFGTVVLNSVVDPLTFQIANLWDANRVALDLDAVNGNGDTAVLGTDLSPFMNLMSGSFLDFSAYIDTSALGTFRASYQLLLSDENIGAASSRDNNLALTLNLFGSVAAPAAHVPEPALLALLSLGIAGMAWRRQKSWR